MLINYIKTAFRNFYRHLFYTVINVVGLSIGLATALFIYLWIADELSYEQHYKDADQIFAAITNSHYSDGRIESSTATSRLLAEGLMQDFPEIASAARTDNGTDRLLRVNDKAILQRGMMADATLFDVFGLDITAGDSKKPLPDINAIVLTESTAKKLFPAGDALGKVVRVEERLDLTVTSVVKDQQRTQLKFDFLISYEHALKENPWMLNWGNINDATYVKLREETSSTDLNSKLEGYVKSKCADCTTDIWLQKYSDTRLHNTYENGTAVGGRIEYVRIFAITGIFILVIACINFMNLATARSATRSRQVGVRKVVGAARANLFLQFMGESILLSCFALIVALAFVQLVLPLFNLATDKQVVIDFTNWKFWGSIVGIVIITGLAAGSYPALFLSAFRPVQVLKGTHVVSGGNGLRKTLVVFQFVLSVVLIICSIVIYKQVGFIKNKNLGFERNNVVSIRMHDNLKNSRDAFKSAVLENRAITNMTFAGQDPFSVSWQTSSVNWAGKDQDEKISFRIINTDKDFINTLGLQVIAGRNFSDNVSDSTNYIVNERALEILGFKDPIGEPLQVWDIPSGKIIGVVKDFHNGHFSKEIAPQIIMVRPANTWTVFAKIENGKIEQALAHLAKVHKVYDPFYPFEYQFLEDKFQAQYKLESATEKISLYFTFVAVFISCLGLFGLASFTAERRTKELGVRKVLGASVANLVSMLCSDFTRLIFIAMLIACPIAFYAMNSFLDRYAYHIELHWTIFAWSGSLILLVALSTVFYQSLKAAMVDPVNSLRNE